MYNIAIDRIVFIIIERIPWDKGGRVENSYFLEEVGKKIEIETLLCEKI